MVELGLAIVSHALPSLSEPYLEDLRSIPRSKIIFELVVIGCVIVYGLG